MSFTSRVCRSRRCAKTSCLLANTCALCFHTFQLGPALLHINVPPSFPPTPQILHHLKGHPHIIRIKGVCTSSCTV